ncbi:hypothetical protein [Sphingomonas sp. PAMC 26605]|uniref:hypothetical protein n=1 Tax=Sphingomonas sp. PAMC 26605 TaxID=1112214 RepID=UPI00026CCB39|nr:hypothetical protein [Sphingomonas sp. PAMC 26605]
MRARALARAAWPFALLALAYLLTVWRVVGLPGLRDPALLYWHDWQDQALYVRSASALAAGNFDPAVHYYPLLYPLLGMPFLSVWPSQPFFCVDLACYLLAFAGFRSVARAFGVPVWGAALLFAATTLAQFGIAKLWIEPWTTTPSAALLWLALGAMARLWEDPRMSVPRRRPGPSRERVVSEDSALLPPTSLLGPGLRRGAAEGGSGTTPLRWPAAILGIALGLIPFARPGDAIIGAIVALAAAVALYRARNGRAGAIAMLSFAIAFGLLATLYTLIYGPAPSPYMLYSAQYGFNFAWLGWKAYVVLVDPRGWFGEGIGLLDYAPWLLLGGAGLIAACVATPRARRPVTVAVAAAGLTYTVLMLAYVDLLPTGLWRFNNLHYFKWVLPLFGLFGVRFVLDARRRPALLLAALPVLLALTIRLEPVRVGPGVPARLAIFPAPNAAEWIPTYFATAWMADTTGELRNSFDYHQILVGGRVYAVALRRPFTGDERWLGDEHVRALLAGKDAGGFAPLYLTGPWPKPALARYGVATTIGLPHWFSGVPAIPKPK